jgi:hypothetical protein
MDGRFGSVLARVCLLENPIDRSFVRGRVCDGLEEALQSRVVGYFHCAVVVSSSGWTERGSADVLFATAAVSVRGRPTCENDDGWESSTV